MDQPYESNEIDMEHSSVIDDAEYDVDPMLDAAAELEADEDSGDEPLLAQAAASVENIALSEAASSRHSSPPTAFESSASNSKPKPKGKKVAAPKPKAKPKPKPKAKPSKAATKHPPKARVAQLKATTGPGSRGRSLSETPARDSSEHETPASSDAPGAEDEAEDERDSKLYCMCETLYDEEKMMIACDQCDEWYHPGCVHLSDAQVELVDVFFCPRCASKNPTLTTSYKAVCARPDCTHPGRAPLSKYCSEDCGIRAVMARVDLWQGDIGRLLDHPVIANAQPREGLLIKAPAPINHISLSIALPEARGTQIQGPSDSRDNEEIFRQLGLINIEIQRISAEREGRERLRQSLDARLQLLARARDWRHALGDSTRCCFDARLVLDEDAWEDWLNDGGWESMQQDAMEVDGPSFCSNKRKCDRHHGWEELKAADFALEDKVLSQRLAEMASRERVLRLRMEELEAQLQARDATATLLAPTKSSSHVTKVEDIS